MIRKPRLILCSGVDVPDNDPLRQDRIVLELNAHGPEANVTVKLEDVAKVMGQHLNGRLADLLEIAAYVYAADSSTPRTGWSDGNSTENWSRDFTFVIPVRDLVFWRRSEVTDLLVKLLRFLDNDDFSFDFRPMPQQQGVQGYLDIGTEDWPFYDVERVIMFSGGLDSLAGTVETAHRGERFVLVSHRPVTLLDKRQRDLFGKLKEAYGDRMTRIPVWVNKDSKIKGEYTQRTRSFLFSALGTVVAASIRAKGVRFFENGIVSLNWPMADEALQARTSRTTHPTSLFYFTKLYSLVLDRPDFIVDNPFVFKTKAEVISLLADKGRAELIGHTCSCAHTGPYKQKGQQHCGACSQCIDRRIAAIAAGQEEYDLEEDYAVDVFTGPRKMGYEQSMGVQYIRHSLALSQMTAEQIAQDFNLELSRAVRHSLGNRSENAQKFIEMHQRHGADVERVVTSQIQQNAGAFFRGSINPTSMLAKIGGMEHKETTWRNLSARITELLTKGLPKSCPPGSRPHDEPELQRHCDAILSGLDTDLRREFPFVTWSIGTAKPDFSSKQHHLWVELKYVRKKSDIREITEDISSDITKYGDSCANVLYVIYDPEHFIIDDDVFSGDIERHRGMIVSLVR